MTALRKLPKVDDEWLWVFEAYLRLSRCRSVGFVENPIAYTDIRAAADELLIVSPDERYEFFKLIAHMDDVWLSTRAEISSEKDFNSDKD